jgi:Uma2 family endonuclease
VATASKASLTAEEFMDQSPDGGSSELVRGEVVELAAGTELHGRVCFKVAFALETFGIQTGHGYVAVNDTAVVTERGPDTVRGGDVVYYSRARRPESELSHELSPIPPDLVVEVYSPSDRASKVLGKVHEYLDAGVLMVWVVHPVRRNVTIYRPDDPTPTVLDASAVLEGLPELPGFRCPVVSFFP